MKRNIFFIVFILLISSADHAIGNNNKHEANNLMNEACSILQKAGGIGELEVPSGMDPFDPQRGELLNSPQRREQIIQAIQKLKNAVALDDSLPEAYHYLGIAYVLVEEPDKALNAFQTAIEKGIQNKSSFLISLGLCWTVKRYDEANILIEKYKRTFFVSKEEESILYATNYYFKGDYQRSLEYGKRVLEQMPDELNGLIIVANSSYQLGDIKYATEVYDKITDLYPSRKKEIEEMKKNIKPKVEQK